MVPARTTKSVYIFAIDSELVLALLVPNDFIRLHPNRR